MPHVGTEVVLQPPSIGTEHHTVPAAPVGGGGRVPVVVRRGQEELSIPIPLELALCGLVIETNPECLLLLGEHTLHQEGVLLLAGDGDQVGIADVAVLA